MAVTLNSPTYNTDVNPNKLTLNGTHPILHLNRPVTRTVAFTIAQLTSASGTSAAVSSQIDAADLVRVMKVPVGAKVSELAVGLSNHSIVGASTTLTVGLGANSNALVTTMITAAKGEVTKNTIIRMTDRLTTLQAIGTPLVTVAASSSSNSADVISFIPAGAGMSHVASGIVTVSVTYEAP